MIYECPKCNQDCDTYEEDQRFSINGQTVGSVFLISQCHDAVVAIIDDLEPEEIDWDGIEY